MQTPKKLQSLNEKNKKALTPKDFFNFYYLINGCQLYFYFSPLT